MKKYFLFSFFASAGFIVSQNAWAANLKCQSDVFKNVVLEQGKTFALGPGLCASTKDSYAHILTILQKVPNYLTSSNASCTIHTSEDYPSKKYKGQLYTISSLEGQKFSKLTGEGANGKENLVDTSVDQSLPSGTDFFQGSELDFLKADTVSNGQIASLCISDTTISDNKPYRIALLSVDFGDSSNDTAFGAPELHASGAQAPTISLSETKMNQLISYAKSTPFASTGEDLVDTIESFGSTPSSSDDGLPSGLEDLGTLDLGTSNDPDLDLGDDDNFGQIKEEDVFSDTDDTFLDSGSEPDASSILDEMTGIEDKIDQEDADLFDTEITTEDEENIEEAADILEELDLEGENFSLE